jgi:hypothetical protein
MASDAAIQKSASRRGEKTPRGESVRATLFERGEDHRAAATYNPDRSYT